jgi:broad specificity phosphatase PhoE
MSSALESVEWGKQALSLLSNCGKLEANLPAVMHIRHSERPPINSVKDRNASLTETGKKAAYDFGVSLPIQRVFRIFHSPAERSRQTAEMIHKGLTDIGAETTIKGNVDIRLKLDEDKFWHYYKRDVLDEQTENVLSFFINFASNNYPLHEFESSLSFSKRIAGFMMDKLHTASNDGFDLYISHDLSVACFLFHWCRVLPVEWINLLDGFILQFSKDKITLFRKLNKREAYYPYWWNDL